MHIFLSAIPFNDILIFTLTSIIMFEIRYVSKLDTTFLLKMQLLLKYWSNFAHFFHTMKLTFLHVLELFAKNLIQNARRRCIFSSIHMNSFLSNFIFFHILKFSGLLSSFIFISYSNHIKYIR